jgi:hypothetical protein
VVAVVIICDLYVCPYKMMTTTSCEKKLDPRNCKERVSGRRQSCERANLNGMGMYVGDGGCEPSRVLDRTAREADGERQAQGKMRASRNQPSNIPNRDTLAEGEIARERERESERERSFGEQFMTDETRDLE